MNKQNGFTLIELMVTVSILGLLASISTPLLNTYRAKSRSVEAKTLLAGLFTAEEGWYAEYDTYSSCLDEMGHRKPSEHYYSYGFTGHAQGTADLLAVNNGAPPTCNSNTAEATFFNSGTKAVGAGSAPTRAEMQAAKGDNLVAASGGLYKATAYGYVGDMFAHNIPGFNPTEFLVPSAYAATEPSGHTMFVARTELGVEKMLIPFTAGAGVTGPSGDCEMKWDIEVAICGMYPNQPPCRAAREERRMACGQAH